MDERKRKVLRAPWWPLYGLDGEPVGSGLLAEQFRPRRVLCNAAQTRWPRLQSSACWSSRIPRPGACPPRRATAIISTT